VTVNRSTSRSSSSASSNRRSKPKGVAFKTLYAGRRGFATILRELTGASVAGRDAFGHVSTATMAHYEKAVPEAVLKGMRLLEEAESHLINGSVRVRR
jgi:hypothetical protein